jgi:molybdopterin/thiamine biosynthesis adenylyltransferase
MALTSDQLIRYERQIQLPEVGEAGQERLLKSKVLIVGAGGLGSPVALYLAGAGVGVLGIVDDDRVSLSNLPRQVLYSETQLGHLKVGMAEAAVSHHNSEILVVEYPDRLTDGRVDWVFGTGWDIVVDACDNLATRYLINEACVKYKIPWIHGAVARYEGQVTKFVPGGACYRCLYPDLDITHGSGRPPGVGGVLGVVPGMIGMIQATEVLKHLLRIGTSLEGRMILFDARYMSFQELKLRPQTPNCPVCSRELVCQAPLTR